MDPNTQVPQPIPNQPVVMGGAPVDSTPPKRNKKKLRLVITAIVVVVVVVVVAIMLAHRSSNPGGKKDAIIYQTSGKPGAASTAKEPIKVGDYPYVNACNAMPESMLTKALGGTSSDPNLSPVVSSTYAEATTAPAYTSDDGIKSDCSISFLGADASKNYDLSLVELLTPDMMPNARHIDKAIVAKMEPVAGLDGAYYGNTYENGDGVYGSIGNIYYKLSVSDTNNATSGGQTTDPQLKATIVNLAKELSARLRDGNAGDSHAVSTASTTTKGSTKIINNPCDIFTNQIFATGLKQDSYIPAAGRIPDVNDIEATYDSSHASVADDGGTSQSSSTCERQSADTTNYGKERAGSESITTALSGFTDPASHATADMSVMISAYGTAAEASEEMNGTVYLGSDGAQPVSGYGDSAVYIPVASLDASEHVSQFSVQKGAYIIDFTYNADISLDQENNKTAVPSDYAPYINPVLARLP